MLIARSRTDTALVTSGLLLEHPGSLELLGRLERIARSEAPVLLCGETGTGKEVFARELHARSPRAGKAFLAVNAGGFSEQLIESELFGHEKGAFTGAHERKSGWFEAADGGTLFLDEIGDLALPLQVKLLRVLATGVVTRIGARTPTHVDVRIITATNVDLMAAMRAGRFREDLFYRLSVTSLTLPPLRERRGDILPLARHFLARYGAELDRGELGLSAEAADALLAHDWPGNVRELENVMRRAAIFCSAPRVAADDLGIQSTLGRARSVELERSAVSGVRGGSRDERFREERFREERPSESEERSREERAWESLEQALSELLSCAPEDLHARVEGRLMELSFERAGHNQLETARILGLSRHVARARLIEHGQLRGLGRGARNEPRVLRIGYQTLGLLSLVRAHGVFDEALGSRRLSIHWQEYAGGIQIVEALRRGELDVGVVGDCPAVCAQADGVPIVYVASEPPTPHGAALIAPQHSNLRDVRDLRGKRVAVNRAAQAHFLLMLALEEAGLGIDDIELSFEAPLDALSAFQRGDIDAWAIWDPWLSSARIDLGARVLRDTRGLFETSVYYLARQQFAEAHPELVAEFRAQLDAAARWFKRDPIGAARLVAPRLGLSPRALAASLDRELSGDGITPAQIVAQQHIADQCLRLRLIPRPISIAEAQWHDALSGEVLSGERNAMQHVRPHSRTH